MTESDTSPPRRRQSDDLRGISRIVSRPDVITWTRVAQIGITGLGGVLLSIIAWNWQELTGDFHRQVDRMSMIESRMTAAEGHAGATDERITLLKQLRDEQIARDELELHDNSHHLDAQDKVLSGHESRLSCLEHAVRGGCR